MIAVPESEKTLLASVLFDSDNWYDASSVIKPDDFSLDSHRRIWIVMGEMLEKGQSVDELTVQQELQQRGWLGEIGGASYLASLSEGVPRRPNIAEHVRRMRKVATQRRVAAICEAGAAMAFESSPEETADWLQTGLEEALTRETDEAEVAHSLAKTMNTILTERGMQRTQGLSYGIPSLDDFTGGMRKGEVTVVGARSGVGKTSLACQAVVANCSKGIPVCLFSLEMTREQIDRRLLSIVSGVPYRHVVNPWESTQEEVNRFTESSNLIAEWPLRVYDAEDMNLARMLALGRVAIRRHKSRLIIVDYAQEVDAPGKDERAKVMLTCRKLTRLVKQENCALMLLSQLVKLSRENYGKPPIVSDLIESGKLENVAHCVLLLHRGWDEQRRRIAEDAELIIPKQRRGETGVLKAKFNRSTATFEQEESANGEWYV